MISYDKFPTPESIGKIDALISNSDGIYEYSLIGVYNSTIVYSRFPLNRMTKIYMMSDNTVCSCEMMKQLNYMIYVNSDEETREKYEFPEFYNVERMIITSSGIIKVWKVDKKYKYSFNSIFPRDRDGKKVVKRKDDLLRRIITGGFDISDMSYYNSERNQIKKKIYKYNLSLDEAYKGIDTLKTKISKKEDELDALEKVKGRLERLGYFKHTKVKIESGFEIEL